MGLWNSSLGLSDLDCEVLGSDINGHFKNFQQKVHKSISNVGLHRPFEFKWLSKKTSRLVSRPSAFLAWVLTISTSFAPHRLTRWKVDLIQKTRGSLWKRRFLFDRFWYQKPRVLGQQSARFAWNKLAAPIIELWDQELNFPHGTFHKLLVGQCSMFWMSLVADVSILFNPIPTKSEHKIWQGPIHIDFIWITLNHQSLHSSVSNASWCLWHTSTNLSDCAMWGWSFNRNVITDEFGAVIHASWCKR